MNLYNNLKNFILFAVTVLIFSSCIKNHSLEITPLYNGNVIITFSHKVKGENLKFDTMLYKTSLGNEYEIDNLKYFISEISFHSVKKAWQEITMDKGIHYVDASDNYSCSWWVNDLFPAGSYDTVSFTFGLNEHQNLTGLFPDPPQRDMLWPEILGGGYHYMMMDLKWENSSMTQAQPFNFHLGIGQMYAGDTLNTDSIIGYIQNYFRVRIPCKLEITQGKYHQVILEMNLEKWFDGKYAFDFSNYPDGIMQVQEGMFKACANGRDAFSVNIPK